MVVMVGLLASGCFGPGTFRVGTDIQPGTYQNSDSSAGCYWARLSGFGGTLGEIIANNLTYGIDTVTISSTDVGFTSQQCGIWTLVAPVPATNDCRLDALMAYTEGVHTITDRGMDVVYDLPYAQTPSDFGLLHDRMVKVRADAAELNAPPCAADIQRTWLQAFDATVNAFAAAEAGDIDAEMSYVDKAAELFKSANEQLKQLGRDLGLPGY